MSNHKGWRIRILRTTFVEMMYVCWMYRNRKIYENDSSHINDSCIDKDIIERIVHKYLRNKKLCEHVTH